VRLSLSLSTRNPSQISSTPARLANPQSPRALGTLLRQRRTGGLAILEILAILGASRSDALPSEMKGVHPE